MYASWKMDLLKCKDLNIVVLFIDYKPILNELNAKARAEGVTYTKKICL